MHMTHKVSTEHCKPSMCLGQSVIQGACTHPLEGPLHYTASYLSSHRGGGGQLVIGYPEIPEAGKG